METQTEVPVDTSHTALPLDGDLRGPDQVIPDDGKPFLAIRNSIASGDIDHAQDLICSLTPEEHEQWQQYQTSKMTVEALRVQGRKF